VLRPVLSCLPGSARTGGEPGWCARLYWTSRLAQGGGLLRVMRASGRRLQEAIASSPVLSRRGAAIAEAWKRIAGRLAALNWLSAGHTRRVAAGTEHPSAKERPSLLSEIPTGVLAGTSLMPLRARMDRGPDRVILWERDEKALVPERTPYMWWLGQSPNHHICGSVLRARGFFTTLLVSRVISSRTNCGW